MAVTDWIQTAAVIYFAWRQNRIFERQNEIFSNQSGHAAMPDKASQIPWIRQYWPTMVMVGLAALTGYDIYARHGAPPIVPWWFYVLLLLIVAVVGWGGRRTTAKAAPVVASEDTEAPRLKGELASLEVEHHRCRQIRDGALADLRLAQNEIERLKASQPKLSTYSIPPLRLNVLEMCSELQGFMSAHGHEPEKPERKLPETQEDFLRRYHQWQQDKVTWGTKFTGDFRLQLLDRISHLCDEVLARAHLNDYELIEFIDTAANDRTGNANAVERIITKFWALALKINV